MVMTEKELDAYNFYKGELEEYGYIASDDERFYNWLTEAIKEDLPEVLCIDFSAAGMGYFVITRRSVLSGLEKIAKQNIRKTKQDIRKKQKTIDALVKVVKMLRREENR